MYRFALRPRWLLSHAFAIAVIVLFVNLGFWQLRRLDQRIERNDTIVARTELPAVPVTDLVGETVDVETLRFRHATATGPILDQVVLVDNRSENGLPGAWVLSPMRLDDGSVLVVNRGFQAFRSGELNPPAPPDGDVSVLGTIVPWDQRSCGVRTDDAGDIEGMACLRRDAVEDAFGSAVLPVVLQRDVSEPPAPDVLSTVPPPELGEGPHRSYAFQWFTFATIIAIVYPLILRRVARDRARPGRDESPVDEPVAVP